MQIFYMTAVSTPKDISYQTENLLSSLNIHLNYRAKLLKHLETNFKNLLGMELTASASFISK